MLLKKNETRARYTIDCPFILISIANRCVTLSVYANRWRWKSCVFVFVSVNILEFYLLLPFVKWFKSIKWKRESVSTEQTQQINKTSIQTVLVFFVFIYLDICVSGHRRNHCMTCTRRREKPQHCGRVRSKKSIDALFFLNKHILHVQRKIRSLWDAIRASSSQRKSNPLLSGCCTGLCFCLFSCLFMY